MNDGAVQLGSVMSLNLDVVGAFGLHFAGELQAAITESRAKVFADTTLNGVSGKQIIFQNTNTYRYRDNNLDPETGEPVYSGVTKEIVSGLKLEVTGDVTGDGMITSRITASVSRQGTDLSTTTGNPPPTSEKVITTEVRAKSGEPVVLSGLGQEEESENVSRTPLLSKIPLIGALFKGKEKSTEKTELVIYLLPSAEIFGKTEDEKNIEEENFKSGLRAFVEELLVRGENEREI
jgi:type II secretory pathway component GspD/PulD (secretin)